MKRKTFNIVSIPPDLLVIPQPPTLHQRLDERRAILSGFFPSLSFSAIYTVVVLSSFVDEAIKKALLTGPTSTRWSEIGHHHMVASLNLQTF